MSDGKRRLNPALIAAAVGVPVLILLGILAFVLTRGGTVTADPVPPVSSSPVAASVTSPPVTTSPTSPTSPTTPTSTTSPRETTTAAGVPTTAGSGPFPDEDEQKLLTLLPPEYNNPAAPICERLVVENSEENVMLQYRPRAAIICYPRGGEPEPPDEVIFARYSSDRTADNVLDGVFAGVTVTDGTCPDQPTLTTYTQGEKESGRIGCFLRDSGEAYLEWTTQKPRVFAIAYNKNGKLDRLYEWWQSGRAAVG